VSRARVYTRCTPMYTGVHNRCTYVYKWLFAMAVALVKRGIDLFGNVFITEMGIVCNDRFEGVVQHNRGFEEITAIPYPFGGPDRTDDMGMPVFAGVPIDKLGHLMSQTYCCIGASSAIWEDMGTRIGVVEEQRSPVLQIRFKHGNECRRKRQTKDILSS